MRSFTYAEEENVGTQQLIESYKGHEITVTTIPCTVGGWQSRAEIELGQATSVVFEPADRTFDSAEEAHQAALTLATENIGRSRIAKKK